MSLLTYKVFVCSILFLFLGCRFTMAQVSDTIEVGFTKSAFLLFNDKDLKFDCGNEEVLVRHSDNKLILQAEVADFEETNLFVQSGNEIFLFVIVYTDQPKVFLYNFTSSKPTQLKEQQSEEQTSETTNHTASKSSVLELTDFEKEQHKKELEEYENNARVFLESASRITNRGIIKYKINVYLVDIAIRNDKYYLKFELANSSNIPYTLDFLRYWVRSTKRRVKDESYQEIELTSLLEYERPHVVGGKTLYEFVIVMDKFVLIKDKKLVIEYWENNGQDLDLEGGRKIEFDVFYSDILNIRVL